MEEQSYTSTHRLGHIGPVRGSLYLYVGEYLVYPKMEATDLFLKFVTKYENVRYHNIN